MIDLETLVPMPEPDYTSVNVRTNSPSMPELVPVLGLKAYSPETMAAMRADVAREVAKRCMQIANEKDKPTFETDIKGVPFKVFSLISAASAISDEFGLGGGE